MKTIKSKADTRHTMHETIAWMVKGGMERQTIIKAIAAIYGLTPLESSYTNDVINACYLLNQIGGE